MLEDKDLRSVQEVRTKVAAAHQAFLKFRVYTQQQVDAIIDCMAAAARANAESLARLAVEDTGYGNVRDKTAKNLLNSDLLHKAIRPMKTVGVIGEYPERGIIEIAEPVGVIAAILPTTNPTSTAFYKSLISLKGRNAVVISPHPRAVRCTCEAASILARAAVEAGAPEGIIQCIHDASLPGTNELMKHRLTSVVLSTGGTGMVRAAYSSGKPALGVGPGNVPVLLDTSADVGKSVASVVEGKSFDYGTVCSSEQTLVAEATRRDEVLAALTANKAYLCDAGQTEALRKVLIGKGFSINPECVGQAPTKIAEMAGFSVPPETSILVVELQGVGREHPLSAEKLSPVLAVYFVKDFAEGVDACETILNFGGRGHTCVIYSQDDARVREYGLRMPAFRVLVNTSAPQGSTGITTNLLPAMTLGCGAMAGNVTSDNVGPLHLINIKRIAYHVREAASAFESAEGRAFFAGQPLPAPAASRPAGAGGSRVVEAVSSYLAQRGLGRAGAASAAAPKPTVTAVPAAGVVDRFLDARRTAPSSCALPAPPPAASSEKADAGPSPSKESPAPPAPEVHVTGFVCEDDIRRAGVLGKKIYIDRNTIVTPAASDYHDGHDILVRTD